MNTLLKLTNKSNTTVSLTFQNEGYSIHVKDVSGNDINTTFGFGYKGFKEARSAFEIASGVSFKDARKSVHKV